jgi:hypothetical protein
VGALEPLLGAGGLGVLAIVIINLLVADFRNRRHVGTEIGDAEERANKAEQRAEALQLRLDEERAQRRAAEDREAKLGRALAAQSEKVAALSTEIAKLRESLT